MYLCAQLYLRAKITEILREKEVLCLGTRKA